MKHIILGTAGHIDHGKTTLIKQLSGVDCDTHKEEKLRGITINLGFTHLELPDKTTIGIVDVPGHADFVNTMISGASGIDLVILVIAADAGIMPQTREHLEIMQILNIKHGIVVLNKIDLVDDELLELAIDEIEEFTSNTFLENKPIIKVSAKTGAGLSELKNQIMTIVKNIPEKETSQNFRMFIDRIFQVQGFGTVVTGSVINGSIKKNENLYLLPGAKKLRIRRLERFGNETEEIFAGDRASLNLVGLNNNDFKKGMILSKDIFPETLKIDANLRLFENVKKIGLWSQVIFLSGTYSAQARIHLIDKDELSGEDESIVQIHLDKPFVTKFGDAFVLRSSSSDLTLGGGIIIDANPLHHRRRPGKLLNNLEKISDGNLENLISYEVHKHLYPQTVDLLAKRFDRTENEILEVISTSLPDNISVFNTPKNTYMIPKIKAERWINKILRHLKTYHKRNPLDDLGRSFEELMGLFGIEKNSSSESIMKIILDQLVVKKKIKNISNTWALYDHKIILSEEDKKQINFVEKYLFNSEMHTPLMSELIPKAMIKGIDEPKLRQILRLLVRRNLAYNVDGNFLHKKVVERCRVKMLKHLKDKKFTVSEFRDVVKGNRKICLLLLTIFDSEKLTFRNGNERIIKSN